MRRLIDAEILTDYFVEHDLALQYDIQHQDRKELERLIAEIPTAYDPDKVVEQLEAVLCLAYKEKERCARENPLQFDSAKGYAMGLSNAIEIVKAGGADAEH